MQGAVAQINTPEMMWVFSPSGLSSRRKQSGSSGYTHRCHQPDNVTDAFTALQPRDNGCHQADEPARKSSVLCHAGRGADRFHPEFGGSAEYRAQQQDSHRIDVSGSCAACGRIRGIRKPMFCLQPATAIFYGRVASSKTAEVFSRQFGKTDTVFTTQSENKGAISPFKSKGQSEGVQERDIYRPAVSWSWR